jgi:DNA mismatch repair ATPase MutS
MALFSGFLAYFSKRPARLLAITHMYEIFRNELVPEVSESFKFAHMKVYKSESGLCYLYRLEEGRGEEQSFAIDCARESGIPESVLQKGKQYYNTQQ